jgi:putative membrane-bound dehydrogenase-like protein
MVDVGGEVVLGWGMRFLLVLFLLVLVPPGGVAAGGEEGVAVAVPGVVEAEGGVWLRAWVKVHDSFFAAHERNLFEESVGFHLSELGGAHEVWVNGERIGGGGAFPPGFRAAEGTYFRYKVPVGTLRKGEWNEVMLRLFEPGGRVGFRGEAPFLMNYFWECVMEGEWEILRGEGHRPAGALVERPERAAFDEFRESQRVLGRAEQVPGPRLAAAESAAAMRAEMGLRVELLLHEPVVAQPFHFSFDERGRLWVAQARQYPYPAGLTMLSRDRYYRSHYDRVPPAPPGHDEGADIISVHEDSTGDGVFDRHHHFLEGLNMANAALPGRGGVWVMHTPYLLFYPDVDGDLVPDGPPEVHLAGFGFEDSHAIANGLAWGPDGWLYGGQGSTVSCRVVRPGIEEEGEEGVFFEGCMVWRYHPETRAFEIFAEGGGNTFGIEFDTEGRLYSGHNGGGTRGWHFVQGGFYQMQGVDPGKFGPPRNPYAFGELPMMGTEDQVVRFTHFGAFGDGSALPSELGGLLFAIDPLHNEIIASERLVRGAGFDTIDRGVAVKSGDEAFRPVYIANAPDGSLYVADMYEYYIAHGQHYQNQIDPTTGRIYRVMGEGMELERDLDLAAKSDGELVGLLGHRNKWHRQTAARLLGERGGGAVLGELRGLIAEGEGAGALGALWALYQCGEFDEAAALVALGHGDAAVRLWAVRFLGDEYGVNRNLGLAPVGREVEGARALSAALSGALLELAEVEDDAEVRAQIASSARRLGSGLAFPLAGALMSHEGDRDDLFLPLLCWWVFEARLPEAGEEVMGFLGDEALWGRAAVVEHLLPRLARRFAVDGRRHELLRVARLLRMAPGREQVEAILKGFEEAYRGRAMTALPEELVAAMADSGGASLAIRLRLGEEEAVAEALGIVADGGAEVGQRLLYVRSFGEVRHESAVAVLLEVAVGEGDIGLRRAAFGSLGAYDHEEIPVATLRALPELPEEARPAAFTLLAGRAAWARRLMGQLEAGEVSLSLVPSDIADHLRLHGDGVVREKALALFPKVAGEGYDYAAKIAEVEAALGAGVGSPYAGEEIYMQRCASCHKLFFKGGQLGPDLTTYQRDNLGTMLLSIIHPDAEIREGYQYITITTTDGRQLSGFQVDRDTRVTVLRGLDGQDVTLDADEIEDVRPMGRSLMPDGLLDDLEAQQLRDLFAYLRISQPITR